MIVIDGRSSQHTPHDSTTAWGENAFERLVQPMGSATFLAQVWERRPCVLSGRDVDYYADVLTTADIDAIIGMSDPSAPERFVELLRYGVSGQQSKPIPRTPHGTPDLRCVYQAYAEGYSIVANLLQRRWQPVSRLCGDLQQTLHHPVGAYFFLTPPAAQAFAPHYDAWAIFILQIEGAKNWKVYDHAVTFPLEHMQQQVEESQLGQPILEVCLKPGDLLYMPGGYVHQALSLDVSSLHLTLGIRTLRWAHVLANALTLAAERDSSLREALPVGFLDCDETLKAMEQRLHEFGGRIFEGVRLEDALIPLGQRYAHAQTMPLDGHLVSMDQMRDIDMDSVVRRRSGMICMVCRTDGQAVLWFQGNRMQAPLDIEPALRFIARAEQFAVRELPDCLTDSGKLVLVRRLVREGLLAVHGELPDVERSAQAKRGR